jgi:hypothetical protein
MARREPEAKKPTGGCTPAKKPSEGSNKNADVIAR